MRLQMILTISGILLGASPVLAAECLEKKSLMNDVHLLDFDKRSTVGEDETIPVKDKILSFIKQNPTITVTDISITSMTSKVPFINIVDGTRVVDQSSDEKNLALAAQRVQFADRLLKKSPELSRVQLQYKTLLAGPDYKALDQNDRWKTKMTPGYSAMVNSLFVSNKEIYQDQALVTSSEALLKEEKFSNLYQAKYKPFHGFKISISGCEAVVPGTVKKSKQVSKQ